MTDFQNFVRALDGAKEEYYPIIRVKTPCQ